MNPRSPSSSACPTRSALRRRAPRVGRLRADHPSRTPRLTADGKLPDNIADQARQARQHVEAALAKAGTSIPDAVSIRQWPTDAGSIKAYTLVRSEFVKHECASMLAVIPALVWPGIKVEIEVVAVRTPAAG